MKRLIINSDDYGRTPDISRGIRTAHQHGVVTSTTCMMNIPTTAADIALALDETPGLGLGVHLVLTMGRPIVPELARSSLTDEHGNLFKLDSFMQRAADLDLDEIRTEWRAQVEAFVRAAGRKPTHLDSHHHSSYFTPAWFRAMLELAREFDCAVRFPFTGQIPGEWDETFRHVPEILRELNPRKPDAFFSEFYDEGASEDTLLRLIRELPEGTSEIMCHPGYVDHDFVQESIYNRQRKRELDILTAESVKEAIQASGIALISFSDLQTAA